MSRKFVRATVTFMAASLFLSNLALPALAVGPADAPAVEEHVTPILSADDIAFTALADKYFDDAFKLSPCWATSVGFHQYDDQLEDYSAAGFEREAKMNRDYLAKLQALNPDKLNSLNKLDRELLISHTKAELLSNLEIQNWKRNPDRYSSGVTSAVFDLIKRNFAPLPDCMRSVIAREKLIPGVLAAAKENLAPSMVPPIFASVALEQLPGTISFLRRRSPKLSNRLRTTS